MADDPYTFYDDEKNREVSGDAVAVPRRGRLSSHLPVRFAPDMLASARQFAIEDGMSISAWVRRVVELEVLRRTRATTGPSTPIRVVTFKESHPAPGPETSNAVKLEAVG